VYSYYGDYASALGMHTLQALPEHGDDGYGVPGSRTMLETVQEDASVASNHATCADEEGGATAAAAGDDSQLGPVSGGGGSGGEQQHGGGMEASVAEGPGGGALDAGVRGGSRDHASTGVALPSNGVTRRAGAYLSRVPARTSLLRPVLRASRAMSGAAARRAAAARASGAAPPDGWQEQHQRQQHQQLQHPHPLQQRHQQQQYYMHQIQMQQAQMQHQHQQPPHRQPPSAQVQHAQAQARQQQQQLQQLQQHALHQQMQQMQQMGLTPWAMTPVYNHRGRLIGFLPRPTRATSQPLSAGLPGVQRAPASASSMLRRGSLTRAASRGPGGEPGRSQALDHGLQAHERSPQPRMHDQPAQASHGEAQVKERGQQLRRTNSL